MHTYLYCFPSIHRRIVAEYEKTIAQMIGEFHFEYSNESFCLQIL